MSTETTVTRKKHRAKKPALPNARGKRKESIARAFVTAGTGNVFINKALVSTITNAQLRMVILEPLDYFAGRDKVDIRVTVLGGGTGGQAQAVRTAIAKALVDYSKDDVFRATMLKADRSLLVEDSRRVEPKKFKGPKARARFTKSYR
jgi:small subunit ribosomal protein S9